MSWANLRTNLNMNIAGFTQGLQAASAQTSAFSASLASRLNAAIVDPTKKAKMEFKDVGRIVQGIIVSKMFYGALNAIRNCTSAVIEFSNSLEYSEMMYTNLFGDQTMAKELLEVLKQFAATTPFSYKDTQEATKRLLAYGIQAKNVMYVMNGVMAAASASGDSTKIESLSRAFGQIYTKGRLMNEEMRQLAEAGIPAYQILKEELGLTQKQLQNLGKESIPASVAINALVDGISKRYQGVVDQSRETTIGMLSNIKDIALIVANEAFKGPMTKVRGFIRKVSNMVNEMYDVISERGVGGLFEHLVPQNLLEPLRQNLANVKRLLHDVAVVLKSVFSIVVQLMPTVMSYLNTANAIIGPFISFFAQMLQAIAQSPSALHALQVALSLAAAAFVIFKINAIRAMVATALVNVVQLLSKALNGLSTALAFVAAHPATVAIMLLAGVIIFATGCVDAFKNKIQQLISSVNQMQGINTKSILAPQLKQTEAPLDKFNKQLDTTNDQLANVEKNAKKAKNGLLSFDEVFKITGADGGAGETPDLSAVIPEIPEIEPEKWIPEVDVGQEFTDNLFKNIMDSIKKHISDFGKRLKNGFKNLGIGGIIVTAIAAAVAFFCASTVPYGIFAALATILTTVLIADWSDDLQGNGDKIAGALGAALGFAIGGCIGGPKAAMIGGAIGALAGKFWGQLRDKIGKYGRTASNAIGAAIGAVLGTVLGGPGIGTAVGALAGAVVSDIIGTISNGFRTTDSKHMFFDGLAGLFGAGVGLAIGGPVGAAIGGLATMLAASLVQDISDKTSNRAAVQKLVKASTDLFTETTEQVNDTLSTVGQGVADAAEQYGSLKLMVDDLYTLLSKDQLSDAEKTGILALVDALNEKLPDLNLSYNSVTGEINKQKAEVEDLINKTEAYYMMLAAKDDIQANYKALYELRKSYKAEKENYQSLKDIAEADEQAWIKAKNAYNEASDAMGNLTGDWTGIVKKFKLKDLKDALDTAKAKMDESSEALQFSTGCLIDYEDQMGDTRKSIKDITEDIVGYNDTLNGTSEAAKQAYIDTSTAVGQMGGLFANGAPVLKEEANKIYKAIQEGLYPNNGSGYVDTANNIVYTFGNAVFNKIDYVDGVVGEMTRSANDSMKANADGTEAGTKVASTFAAGILSGKGQVEQAFKDIGVSGKEALRKQLYGFDGLGLMCIDGYVGGIKKNTDKATQATSQLGTDIQKSFTNTMEIKSPSRRFAYFGRMIDAGAAKGITDSAQGSLAAVRKLGTDMMSTMGSTLKTDGIKPKGSMLTDWLTSAYNKVASWSGAVQQVFAGTFGGTLQAPALAGAGNLSIPMPNGSVGRLDTAQYQAYMANNNNVGSASTTNGIDNTAKQVIEYLAPMIANNNSANSTDLPPMYVGTLIADDRGLKELDRRLKIIRVKEERRG